MSEAERTLREFFASKTLADLVCEFGCKAPPEFAAASGGWFQERRAGRTTGGAVPRTGRPSKTTTDTQPKEPPMEIPEKLREVLKKDGVVAIATLGEDGPHMVNTWNSYVRLTDDGRMLIPAGYMNRTEANVAFNPEVLITLGSSKVPGNMRFGHRLSHQGHGGVRLTSGPDFDALKATFSWMRAVVVVTMHSATQTL